MIVSNVCGSPLYVSDCVLLLTFIRCLVNIVTECDCLLLLCGIVMYGFDV